MASGIGAGEADELIDRKLQRSGQLHEAMAQTLALDDEGLEVIDLHGTDVATAALGLSMEHGDSLLVLMARGNPNTATATLRMQFESMLRGAWAIYAASEQDIEALERELMIEADAQARKVPCTATCSRPFAKKAVTRLASSSTRSAESIKCCATA
jgi:hypothetical protein